MKKFTTIREATSKPIPTNYCSMLTYFFLLILYILWNCHESSKELFVMNDIFLFFFFSYQAAIIGVLTSLSSRIYIYIFTFVLCRRRRCRRRRRRHLRTRHVLLPLSCPLAGQLRLLCTLSSRGSMYVVHPEVIGVFWWEGNWFIYYRAVIGLHTPVIYIRRN